jgi:hypothetical protein
VARDSISSFDFVVTKPKSSVLPRGPLSERGDILASPLRTPLTPQPQNAHVSRTSWDSHPVGRSERGAASPARRAIAGGLGGAGRARLGHDLLDLHHGRRDHLREADGSSCGCRERSASATLASTASITIITVSSARLRGRLVGGRCRTRRRQSDGAATSTAAVRPVDGAVRGSGGTSLDGGTRRAHGQPHRALRADELSSSGSVRRTTIRRERVRTAGPPAHSDGGGAQRPWAVGSGRGCRYVAPRTRPPRERARPVWERRGGACIRPTRRAARVG